MSRELLVAATSEAVRDQFTVLPTLIEVVNAPENPYIFPALAWSVMLRAFADQEPVVDAVCDLLRSERLPGFFAAVLFEDDRLLQLAYPPSSPHSSRIAATIESRFGSSSREIVERDLFRLAAVDRGPSMKRALLRDLRGSNLPHWAAEAMIRYFGDHQDILDALRAALMGDAVQASRIANVASRVLGTKEAITRLLEIIHDLQNVPATDGARADFVVSALIGAYREEGTPSGSELDRVAEQILAMTPATVHPLFGDQRFDVAAEFFPAPVAQEKLAELAGAPDRPLEPYLRAFKNDPGRLEPLLMEASGCVRCTPSLSACTGLPIPGGPTRLAEPSDATHFPMG